MFQEAYYREDCHFREVCYKLPRKLSALQKRLTCLEEFVIKKNAIFFQEVQRTSSRNIYVAEKRRICFEKKAYRKDCVPEMVLKELLTQSNFHSVCPKKNDCSRED